MPEIGVLSPEELQEQFYKLSDSIRELQAKPNRKNATTFWSLLNYAIWKRLFIDDEPVESLLGEIGRAPSRPSSPP